MLCSGLTQGQCKVARDIQRETISIVEKRQELNDQFQNTMEEIIAKVCCCQYNYGDTILRNKLIH